MIHSKLILLVQSCVKSHPPAPHDYSSISPSAYTFAREAAALLENASIGQDLFTSDFGQGSANYWITVMHFESRYWSIDQLLEDQPCTNVLDPAAFKKIIARFPPGPIAIVNEGLLVYLDDAEKETLCQNIHDCLLARGGCWITADIYLQKQAGLPPVAQSDSSRQWHEQHKIEEKKFINIQEAESFFHRMGFTVDKEARPNYDRLSSFARFREAGGASAIDYLRQPGRARQHATWRLLAQKMRPANNQTHWQMSAASQLGPKPWFFI